MRCRQEFKEILTAAGYWENASSQRSFSWSISLIWYHLFDSTIFLTDWEGRLKSSIRTWKIWLQNWRRFFTWEVSMKLQIVAQLWHMGKDLRITIMKYLMLWKSNWSKSCYDLHKFFFESSTPNMKTVLVYRFQTWRTTSSMTDKSQTFLNRWQYEISNSDGKN